MTKKVVLMGKGSLAVRIAQWFYDSEQYALEYIIPVVPEPTWTESLIDWATTNHVRTVRSGHYRDAPQIRHKVRDAIVHAPAPTLQRHDRAGKAHAALAVRRPVRLQDGRQPGG